MAVESIAEMSGYIPTLIDDVAKELGARVEVITWAEWPIPSRILDQAFESGTIDMAVCTFPFVYLHWHSPHRKLQYMLTPLL